MLIDMDIKMDIKELQDIQQLALENPLLLPVTVQN